MSKLSQETTQQHEQGSMNMYGLQELIQSIQEGINKGLPYCDEEMLNYYKIKYNTLLDEAICQSMLETGHSEQRIKEALETFNLRSTEYDVVPHTKHVITEKDMQDIYKELDAL